jgi:hypothetical protein
MSRAPNVRFRFRGLLDARGREGVFVASRSPGAVVARAASQAVAPRLRERMPDGREELS